MPVHVTSLSGCAQSLPRAPSSRSLPWFWRKSPEPFPVLLLCHPGLRHTSGLHLPGTCGTGPLSPSPAALLPGRSQWPPLWSSRFPRSPLPTSCFPWPAEQPCRARAGPRPSSTSVLCSGPASGSVSFQIQADVLEVDQRVWRKRAVDRSLRRERAADLSVRLVRAAGPSVRRAQAPLTSVSTCLCPRPLLSPRPAVPTMLLPQDVCACCPRRPEPRPFARTAGRGPGSAQVPGRPAPRPRCLRLCPVQPHCSAALAAVRLTPRSVHSVDALYLTQTSAPQGQAVLPGTWRGLVFKRVNEWGGFGKVLCSIITN